MESKQKSSFSLDAESYELFMGHWTDFGSENDGALTRTVRQDLTKSIGAILPLLQDELKYAFEKELGNSTEWHAIPLLSVLLRMVALLSGRVFVGSPLHRNEEWVDASINYTVALASVARESRTWNPLLVPFVAPFLPSVKKTRRYLYKAKEWMKPLVSEIVNAEKEAPGRPAKVGQRGTFISWLLNYLPAHRKTASRIGKDQMALSFAAIHTTSSTGTMVRVSFLLLGPGSIRPAY